MLSYNHSGKTPIEISGIDGLSYTVDVLGGIQFQFHVRAVTIKPGTKALLIVDIPEYSKFSFLLGSSHFQLFFLSFLGAASVTD